MRKRLSSAFVAVVLFFATLYGDSALGYSNLVNYAVALLIFGALYEIYKPFGFIRKMPLAIVGAAFGLSIAFGSLRDASFIVAAIIFYMLLMFSIAMAYRKTVSFSDISILMFTTIYISLCLAHVGMVNEGPFGAFLIVYMCVGAFMTDSGAYFVGKFFGKRKLLPEISPKKTVEGSIGGIITAMVSFGIYAVILMFMFGFKINWLSFMGIGFISTFVAQAGDLSASMIKRELNLKDYGSIMPGHGGILDRLDSLIFVAPLVYYLNLIFPVIMK